MTMYTDDTAYGLALTIASRVTVSLIDFDPTSDPAIAIARNGHRATLTASEDGRSLQWELFTVPRRGRWREVSRGTGDAIAAHDAVLDHLDRAGQ